MTEKESENERTVERPSITEILKKIDSENEKRKQAESELEAVADELKNDIPEEYRELVPDLPPAQLMKWLRQATSKGIFAEKQVDPIDSKRPNDKKPTDLSTLTPHQMMSMGYKTN